MNRESFTPEIISKLSAFSWIKLGDIEENEPINLDVTVDLLPHFEREIESAGFKIWNVSNAEILITGPAKNISELAKLPFVKYISLSNALKEEK